MNQTTQNSSFTAVSATTTLSQNFSNALLSVAILTAILFVLCFLLFHALEPCFSTCHSCCTTDKWPEVPPVLSQRQRRKRNKKNTFIEFRPVSQHTQHTEVTIDESPSDQEFHFNDESHSNVISETMASTRFWDYDYRIFEKHMASICHQVDLGSDTKIYLTPNVAICSTTRKDYFA